jgi:glyoxylase-like metal-dependent hydrolase (beta-lactamase superfamily II)
MTTKRPIAFARVVGRAHPAGILVAAALAATGPSCAESTPRDGASSTGEGLADDVLARTLAHMVGSESRAAMGSGAIRYVAHGWNAEPGQARVPESSTFASAFRARFVDDLPDGRVRAEWKRWFLYPQRSAQLDYVDVVHGDQGFTVGRDGQFAPPFTPPYPPRRMFAARAAAELKRAWMTQPLRLLERAVQDGDGLVTGAVVEYRGRPHVEIVIPGAVLDLHEMAAPIRVFIDRSTLTVSATRAVERDPVYGEADFTVAFTGWTTEVRCADRPVTGARLPDRLEYWVRSAASGRGHQIHTERRTEIDVCAEVDPAEMRIPSDLPPLPLPEGPRHRALGLDSAEWFLRMRAFGAAIDMDFETLPPGLVHLDELASGVFLVSLLTHNTVVVEMPTYLVVVEAPVSDRASELVLDAIRERWSDRKTVRYVINTHFHHDHAGGLRRYVEEGAAPIVPDSTRRYYRELYDVDAIAVRRHAEPYRLRDAGRTVDIHAVDDTHVDGNLLVYLPGEKILINADLFGPGEFDPDREQRDPGYPVPDGFFHDSAVLLLEELLPRLGLAPDLFVGIHGTAATREEFERAVARAHGTSFQ